jgi:hypothetical protein
LNSGDVLVEGGNDLFNAISGAELFDPATGSWAATGGLPARYNHSANLLPDGSVLVVGGTDYDSPTTRLSSTFRYDPGLGTFLPSGTLTTARSDHGAALLDDGRVLVVGGSDAAGDVLASVEVYDSALGTWSAGPPLIEARMYVPATKLLDGRVLVAGGDGDVPNQTAETFDPAQGVWTPAGNLSQPKWSYSSALLPSGEVLIAGGRVLSYSLDTADVFNPVSGTWTPADPLPEARETATANVLSDGRVLVVGGECWGFNCPQSGVAYHTGWFFDPSTNAWNPGGEMILARSSHASASLDSDQVLVMGGFVQFAIDDAEVYARFGDGEPCTDALECSSGYCVERVCCDSACDALCVACTAANKGGGADGSCGPVAVGTDPDGDCADEGSPRCGQNGWCDGGGSCSTYGEAPCVPEACGSPSDCASGYCVDGICCNAACDGECQACTARGGSSEDGLCQPALAGTDPHNDCPDGNGSGSCVGVQICNGNGECADATTVCSPYLCIDPNQCGTACRGDEECIEDYVCDSGACVPRTSSCDGHVVHASDGSEVDCTPYVCNPDGSCRSTCGSVDDCVAPTVCNTLSQCVESLAGGSPEEEDGCSCTTPGLAKTSGTRNVLCAIVLAFGVARRSRRRRMQ